MNRSVFKVVPLVLALAACSGPAVPVDAQGDALGDVPAANAHLVLGTGQLSWDDIAPTGTHVELIHGPQGGYHIFGRVRFDPIGPDVYVRFRVTPAEGGAPLNDPMDRVHLSLGRGLVATPTGWESSNAMLVILVAIHGPSEVVGRRFRFEAMIASAPGGPETSTSREIVIVDKT